MPKKRGGRKRGVSRLVVTKTAPSFYGAAPIALDTHIFLLLFPIFREQTCFLPGPVCPGRSWTETFCRQQGGYEDRRLPLSYSQVHSGVLYQHGLKKKRHDSRYITS